MITLEEFKKNHLDKCRLIGLDLGSKRIGVSICDEKQLIATPNNHRKQHKGNHNREPLKYGWLFWQIFSISKRCFYVY